MLKNKWLWFGICLIMGTVLGLTSHIYLQEWTQPILDSMSRGILSENSAYPPNVIMAAYATATITIVFGMKGELIRMPLMNILLNYNLGMSNPFLFGVIASLDQWVASLLTAASLVYLCPKKITT